MRKFNLKMNAPAFVKFVKFVVHYRPPACQIVKSRNRQMKWLAKSSNRKIVQWSNQNFVTAALHAPTLTTA